MSAKDLSARLAERQQAAEDFEQRWYGFCRRWRRAMREGPEAAASLVTAVLASGLPEQVRDVKEPPLEVQHSAARSVVAASGFLDEDEYVVRHRLRRSQDPVRHFVEVGWRLLQNPSPRFDLWTYWVNHLDPTSERVNPLLHFLLWGRFRGLPAVATVAPTRTPVTPPSDAAIRRVCLFAAYDKDGIVDDCVVGYLRELSRHADVYYLADGVLEPGELDKLADVTAGAWSIPHGAYDFGSFSLLARELVGWDVIDGYDELLLANDSCFLLRPLDEVLSTMDARACDWWSLQATTMEHDENYFLDDSPIPLAEAKRRFVGPRQWSDVRYLHLSSYFLVFRRPVFTDPGFRWRLDTVAPQTFKSLVVDKYEVGISRYLLDEGFDFDTWLDALYAFHPLYSRHFFDCVALGFPLVKRNFLGENPRRVPGLDRWPERIRELAPDADVEAMQAAVLRVTDPAQHFDAYAVTIDEATGRRTVPESPHSLVGTRGLDRETPLMDHWWAFPVGRDGRLDPGQRAVFEVLRDDPTIRKVVLPAGRRLDDDVTGDNVVVAPLMTLTGQEAFVRCAVALVAEPPAVAVPFSLYARRRRFVHVGEGRAVGALRASPLDWSDLHAVCVEDEAHAASQVARWPGLSLGDAWSTGLPRHDLLVAGAEELPRDLADAEHRLRERLDGRPLVVWWPAEGSTAAHEEAEVARLREWARAHDVVVGVREARADGRHGYTARLRPLAPIGLGPRSVMSSTIVARAASAVVTNASVDAGDALVLGTPLVVEDGDFDRLLHQLDEVATSGFARTRPQTLPDGGAARRLVLRIRSTSG